jgi:hypothetical protein
MASAQEAALRLRVRRQPAARWQPERATPTIAAGSSVQQLARRINSEVRMGQGAE